MDTVDQKELVALAHSQARYSDVKRRALEHLQEQLNDESAWRSPVLVELMGLVSECFLNQAKHRGQLEFAYEFALEAESLARRGAGSNTWTENFLQSMALRKAVCLKALGEGYRAMRQLEVDLDSFGGRGRNVMLRRQIALISQEPRLFRELFEDAQSYKYTHPLEYYSTVKRVFEFAMNNGKMDDALILAREFNVAFMFVQHRLSYLSKLSFEKNIAQFLALVEHRDRALMVLRTLQVRADAKELLGQSRQIQGMKILIEAGRMPVLGSFVV